jgi:hypothetical protein
MTTEEEFHDLVIDEFFTVFLLTERTFIVQLDAALRQ